MTEPLPSETRPKKMVSRNVAIVLGIICIILFAGLVGVISYLYAENTNLQNQNNDLNKVVDFQKTVTWLNNQTITINPNQNTTEWFNASLGGKVTVTGSVEPNTVDFDINLSYTVVFGGAFPAGYTVSPMPYVVSESNNFNYQYPIISFGQSLYYPNVELVFTNLSDNSITVNMTVTFAY